MAEQMDRDIILAVKEKYPDYIVVACINTTAELKTICDVCVTSSSAVKIVRKIPSEKILFIPDCNLGDYVRKNVPEKEIKLLNGGCPTHARITLADLKKAKAAHPPALVLVHPECRPDVTAAADFAGSTSANIITLGKKEDLFTRELMAGNFNFISGRNLREKFRAKAKIRYRQAEQRAEVTVLDNESVRIVFDEPQRAVTKGQAAVLYDGDIVIGGGTIS